MIAWVAGLDGPVLRTLFAVVAIIVVVFWAIIWLDTILDTEDYDNRKEE